MDLAAWPHFFDGAAIGLAIDGAISIGKKIAIGFLKIFLW